MESLINVNYEADETSVNIDSLGMREMQQRAYSSRNEKYILIKAPPASGKSRALMFIGLDKLNKQGISKIIIAVPERSIAKSFANANLIQFGFDYNWEINEKYNLCRIGGEKHKVETFLEFVNSNDQILLCTHSTLRFAIDKLEFGLLDNSLIAIDEFHHVSSDYNNKLGEVVRSIMDNTSAHIIAMTGSYFRGDGVPVLFPEDEIKFKKVTYNYYEQLNGYKYLKTLDISFGFYQGKFYESLEKVLSENKKTIIHIPNINAAESTKDKYDEVDKIYDILGKVDSIDENNIIHIKTKNNKLIKVADLVNDDPVERDKVIRYLRDISSKDDIDLIIALGMAKEGFDWPYCEHALTIGYRGSLTEIIQIIGRCTRDCEGKSHAQFTNFIAEPDDDEENINQSVNNILKAITASLLMEQVLVPNYKFISSYSNIDGEKNEKTILIKGFKETKSTKVKDIIENDLPDLNAAILQDQGFISTLNNKSDTNLLNMILIPKIIKEKYPELKEDETEELRQYVICDNLFRKSNYQKGDKIVQFANETINVEDLDIDLIQKINPFLNSFQILSKQLSPRMFRAIKDYIDAFKNDMTDDEAIILWPKINEYVQKTGRLPSLNSLDPLEKRYAEALVYLRNIKRREKALNER